METAEVEEILLSIGKPKLHRGMCKSLSAVYTRVLGIFPNMKVARPRDTSSIQSLCSLHVALEKTKNILQCCAECSKLYLIHMWQRDSGDRTVLQPTPAIAVDMLSTATYLENPSPSFAAKFVHTSLNKNRCSINRVLEDLLGEKIEIQWPFLSSSSSFSSSMILKEIKLFESALMLSPEPENYQNGRKKGPAVEGGKSVEKDVDSNKGYQGDSNGSISDQSLLAQRCAKRKCFKTKANVHEIPEEFTMVNEKNTTRNSEDRMSDYSNTESEEL